MSTIEIIGGKGWRRRISAKLLGWLETHSGEAAPGGGFDDNSLLDLLRVVRGTHTVLTTLGGADDPSFPDDR